MNDEQKFKDRSHAGQELAARLMKYANRDDVIVLALPRGGVPVAYEVAQKLRAPLEVLVVRKLGTPGWKELAMGAVASGGAHVLNREVVRHFAITREAIDEVLMKEFNEVKRREKAYRGTEELPEVEGKIVILVDDGIATGSSIQAALNSLRKQRAKKIVIAVPVAARDSCTELEPHVEEFVVVMEPQVFVAVGRWYEDFAQTTDEEVIQLLARARDEVASAHARHG